ncbi:MAG: ABC transporter ATP-binding protein [Thermoproteota archaeon]|nr:MAG: ABC transporter ATP-binding protein [Candidatus Korarchaeota archaeon]
MLEVKGVVAGYLEGIDILQGVDLKVERNTITTVIGPNGAGKSTLLKTIFGLLKPRRGEISFEDKRIGGLKPSVIKRLGISYVPQDINTFPHMSVEENLLMGAWVFRGDSKLVRERLGEVFEMFPHLKSKRHMKATYLSGGELKMLSIAKEIVTKPRLLLVDEPTAGLAPRLASQVYSFLVESRDSGITILLVDQNIKRAVEISDYVYMIEMGRVKVSGSGDYFRANLTEIIKSSLLGG